MRQLDKIKDLLLGFLSKLDMAWWVEITTVEPHCTYYFGPFQNSSEARAAYPGYVEDIESEQAQGIAINIKFCRPDVLTVFDEEAELNR